MKEHPAYNDNNKERHVKIEICRKCEAFKEETEHHIHCQMPEYTAVIRKANKDEIDFCPQNKCSCGSGQECQCDDD